MKTVGSFEAKTRLSSLLDEVARGKSFLITKRGKPVASLSPVGGSLLDGPVESIRAFRRKFAKSLGKFSAAEIASLKAEGRR